MRSEGSECLFVGTWEGLIISDFLPSSLLQMVND